MAYKTITVTKPTSLPLPEPVVTRSTQKTAYQQNVSQPVTQTTEHTTRDVLAKINEMYSYDPEKAGVYMSRLRAEQLDPSSKYYNPYTAPTNKAVSNLAAYGFDLNNLNDNWMTQYSGWINSNLLYNGTTNTPSKPGKKATQDQKIAYELYQYQKSEADTKKAEQQWNALKEELTYWTQRKDKNYSDEQVLEKVDWSKYGALVKMDDSLKNFQPVELNRAIDYSKDAMYGVIWNARNPEYKGSLLGAMAYSASGAGNVWKEDPEITARLDTTNPDTYAPYTVGSTMDDACLYYGRDSFDADWVKKNRPDGRDATETKMWNKVEEAERFTTGAEAELEDFNAWLDRRLQSAEDPAEVMKAVDSRLGMSKYKSLKALNDSLNKVDALVNTTRAIDFSYNDIQRKVEETCAKNASKLDGQQTLANNGADIGTEQSRQAAKVNDKNVKSASLMLEGALTEYEQLVLDNTPSFLRVIVKQAFAGFDPVALLTKNEAATAKDYAINMISLSADIAANQDAKVQLDNLYRVNAELVDRLRGLQVDGGYLAMMDPSTISAVYKEVTGTDLGDGPDALRKAGSMMRIIMDTPAEDTPWVLDQYVGKKQELEAQIEKTSAAQAEYDKQQQAWDARIFLYDRFGLDSTPLRAAKAASTAMSAFSDYEASKWDSYNAYQLMEQGMASGASFDQVLQAAQEGHEKTLETLENARWLKEYITENGIGTETMQMSLGPAGISATANLGLPAKYVQNLDRFIEKLERSEEDYKYFALRGEKDFEELAEKGKAIEAQLNLPPDATLEGADENGVSFSTYMTEDEKQTYYYLMAKYGSEDPMKGREEAMRYWSHLADPEYGVISTRGTEAVKAFAGKLVQDSPIVANVMAALAAPLEGFMGALNFGLNAVMGWESNPDSSLLGPGYFSKTVNEETANRIRQEVPEGPLQELALGGYEIIYNRARSFVNAMATGGLSIGGRFGAILTELAGAVPMATGAAAMATADAKRKGADDTTACAIGAVTFMMEDFTEGLTRSNIREAIHGGEDTVFRTVKDRVVHWLTSSGLEEAFGETLTDYVENLVDREWMGARSEHAELVSQYIQELGLDPNNPIDMDRAEQLALQDEAAGLVRTAIISYLSPGTDVLTGTIADQIRDYHNIRTTAQTLQERGEDVTLSDVRKAYKDWKANGPKTQAAPEEGYDRTFADVLGELDAVAGSDETTQAVALSDLFSREENTPIGDVADAAAASMTNVFGTMGSAISRIKNIVTFAHVTNREALVKQALQTAALSPSSEAARVTQRRAFRNAETLEEQVSLLADTVELDARNENVVREIESAVREYRIAAAEKDLIGNGALESVKPLQEAADKAQAAITDAQNDYDSRADEVTAKSKAVKAAQEAFIAEPTADNQHALDRTLGELEKADAVKQEYEQRLENAKAANEDAQAKFEAARDTAMQDIRQQAEQAVAEQDQQRAEAEKQAMIQAELDRTLQQEQQTEANYARAQADEIIAEHYANATEEEKDKIRGIVTNLRQAQQNAVDKILEHKNYVERIAKKYNVKISIGDTTQGGRFLYQNASVNPKTGKIMLSENATVSDAMYAVLVHELTHIAEGSEELYNELADALLKLEYGDNADQMNADINARQELYRNGLTKLREQGAKVNPDDVTPEYARQEIVADLMGKLLSGDDELLNRFAQESPSIARRIVESIKSFLKKMVGIQEAPLTEAQMIVDKLEAALKDVEAQRANAEPAVAKPMVENANGQPLVSELPGGTAVLDPAAKFSLNSFNPDEQKKVRDALISSKHFTRAQVDRYMDDALGVAALIAADRQRLDFEASDNQVFLKPNNDYYFTLDASTLCAKRLLYQGTFDYVQHALPDEVFTPEDLIDLVNIMADMGYETPCGICYVESRRRWLDTYAQKFLDELPAEADGFIEKYFSKAKEEDKAAIREHYADWHPTIDDLTTSDGLEQLRHDNPYMHKAFVDAMNKKGTANPKVVQLRTEYRGDIRNLTQKDIQKVKDIGGLRIQSFSDFETPHLLDMMQAVLDMSAVGLTSQAYTKVSNFAWVFGDTGIKINLSLIGKGTGLDENGNLVFDNREGINFDEAMKLRERYGKNVGTILVGINDEHIIAAMGDPRIDFIIPFHKSGWSAEELRKMPTLHNYEDYTDTQNERLIIGRNKDGSYETESFKKHKDRTKESLENFQPVGKNGYWNFSKSGQWNAEKYLKMCAKAKRVPKFSQFLVDNGDGSFSLPQGSDKRSTSIREGYWKTLIDFKMYENDCYGRTREDGTKTEVKGSKQQEVKPDINMAEAYRVMDEYKLGRQMPDNPDGTPGRFIPMESNNSVPVATPAGDRYIELIKAKRAGIKPAGPNPDTLEADLPADAQYTNPRASAFGAAQAPAVLGNTEGTAEEAPAAQQRAAAIDPETGETRFSLPSQEEIDRSFEEYIEDLSAEELDQLAQELYGIQLSSPAKAESVASETVEPDPIANAKEVYREAVESGDMDTARDVIGKVAKAAGYTVYGTHRTNAKFNTFEKSARSGERGKTLGDGFYIAKGEHTEYDNDTYGKNRMLVYMKPGKTLNLDEGGLTKRQAKKVYDKYFAPYHPNAVGDDNPYTTHVLAQLQKSYKVIDYIKEAAENAGTTTDEVLKDLGYNSVKDGPQYAVFDSSQIKLADPVTYDDEGNAIPIDARFNRRKTDIRYSLPSDAPYLSAVNHGDMETAQDLVDKAAEDSGYTVKVYHGTANSGRFNLFDPAKLNNSKLSSQIGQGFYFTNNMDAAKEYTKQSDIYGNMKAGKNPYLFEGYLRIQNPIEITEDSRDLSYETIRNIIANGNKDWFFESGIAQDCQNEDINGQKYTKAEISAMSKDEKIDLYTQYLLKYGDKYALQHMVDAYKYGDQGLLLEAMKKYTGNDGIHWHMKEGLDQFVAFDSSQFKDASPVTYDDDGNVIPLSERFNTNSDDIRYSLPSDAPYLSAVNHGDMEEAQRLVDERAEESGYVKDAFHGTLNGGYTIFDKQKAHIGGNSGAGFYFSSNQADSEANYSDVEGADNHFKVEHLVEKIQEYISETGENEYAGVQIPEDASYEELEEIAKQMLQGNPMTYHVRLNPGKAYIRDFNNSTNLLENVYDDFDESMYDRNDFDSEDAYEDALYEGRSDHLYEAISSAVYEGIADVDSNFEIVSNVDYESIISALAMQAMDYDALTWSDVSKVIGDQYIDAIVGDGEESADATTEITRAIVEAFGFDSIEDREVSKKFNQLKNMSNGGGTVHYIMFRPNQIKLADPITYDSDGNVIPLSSRFKQGNNDIRYSLPSDNILTDQIRYYMESNGSQENFKIRKSRYSNAPVVEFNGRWTEDEDAALRGLGMTPYRNSDGSWGWRVARGNNVTEDQIRAALQPSAAPQEAEQETYTLRTDTVEEPRQRQWGRKGAQASDELAEIVKRHVYQNNLYTPTTNAKQLDRAIEWIRSNRAEGDEDGYYTSVQKIKNNSYNYRSADGQARMVAVMGLAAAKNDTSTQADLADIFNQQGTSIGQALQARKLWLLMTPEGREQSLSNMLTRTQNDLNAKGTDIDLKLSDWIYMAARASEDENDLQKVYQAAAVELAEQLPQNWRDKFRSWRMLSMLGNPRTHIRNVLGNALFIPVVGLKNKLGAIAELGSDEKTKTLSPWLTKAVRDFARQDAIAMKDELTGEAKYNEDNRVQREQKAFKGLLQAVIDFNSDALEKEDWVFLKGHYRRALGGWMMANGYTAEQLQNDPELLNAGRTYAISEAQKATYRDFNQLAATLNKVSRDGGIGGFLVDAALPFKKTPANILRRGVEYSPVGIMRSLTTDIYHLKQWYDAKNGKLNEIPEKALSPTQFIDRLCSGLAGSAVLAAGFLLGGMGVVSCGLDDDDDKFEKENGGQEYAVNFGKLVNKIFNAKILGEDVTFTMDWAAPMSMPFFVGAALQEQLSKGGDFNAEEVINAFGNITEPVFNLSMLDGVNSLFKTSQYDDTNTITQIGAKIVSNYATSYVPSLLGAVARTVDNTRRKAFVKSGEGTGILGTFRYAMEQTENKIPGLSQTNIPYRDVWGNPETSGLAERIVENFIAPGYISQYKNDPVLNEMDRIYQATGDDSMIPADPNKTVTYKKQKYVLSAEQWDAYKTERGQAAYRGLTELIGTDDYQNASPSTQAQMIKDVWSYSNKVGLAAIIPGYELEANTVAGIAKGAKIDSHKADMIKALNAGDFTAYETMVEALHEEEVEDSEIKAKIRDTYRDQYKTAYKTGNNQRMAEIEDLLDETGYDFSDLISGWEDQVDENR